MPKVNSPIQSISIRGSSSVVRPARWSQERRLEFIESRLFWDGRLNRSELVGQFGISIPQASLDLARYMEIAPQNLKYDRSDKIYKATKQFKAALTKPDAQAFLNQLYAQTVGTLPSSMSFIGWNPPHEVVRLPTREIKADVLGAFLRAIRDEHEIEISYQSMRQSSHSRRWIAPHSIAFDGTRWHVRAWCHESANFRDFVLARVQEVFSSRESSIRKDDDVQWNRFVTLILRPHVQLSKHQRVAVEHEFGMTNGELKIEIRAALVFYFARQMRLGEPRNGSARAQPFEWINEKEFLPLLELGN